ncbi:hypothetical protein DRO97_05415 [Archaeoglobales archaeon]|nr:MAG: hypothetical protein DRO97_05415 [Archaeoglobales archaeon]
MLYFFYLFFVILTPPELKVVLIISISVVIGGGLLYLLAPHIVPFIEEGYKITLKTLGKCPDVEVKILAAIPNNEPVNVWEQFLSWLMDKQYCKVYIQTEVINKGKNDASNVKLYCTLRNQDKIVIGAGGVIINKLLPGERTIVGMNIDYGCEYIYNSSDCTVTYENPCE